MVKSIHTRVPYFKIVSWNVGFNKNEDPKFIEVNTYNQSTELHQIVNSPLFGKFTGEIIELSF
ncbi:hypothetical protein DFQ11_102118 [Winogradskyella epiphytica]|uniref:Uncharacterized protein n=1 Tax=Winogradskyella epiphytica TaxID=262005 RepID=A0A2V4XF93_9FLAO|nr:hypothetical protein DFQ11_102118 [Winogradskyella epiphytica]GGW64398.1 hypothetical protein GCM10008085_15490 [Winogradskyella epiphytica]